MTIPSGAESAHIAALIIRSDVEFRDTDGNVIGSHVIDSGQIYYPHLTNIETFLGAMMRQIVQALPEKKAREEG